MSEALIEAAVDLLDGSLAAMRAAIEDAPLEAPALAPAGRGREPSHGASRACDAQHEVVVERPN